MGIIQCVTPKVYSQSFKGIFRITGVRATSVIRNFAEISIEPFTKDTDDNGLYSMKLDPIKKIDAIEPIASEVVWMFGKKQGFPWICGWNGFMEKASSHKKYASSTVRALPFVNNPPSEYDTIYTTLLYAAEKSKQAGHQTCAGGFHKLMSFLGCIGFIMVGSGLKELFSLIYASISVEKMLLGHAYARAIRGHTLVNLALSHIILPTIDFSEDEELEMEEVVTSFGDLKIENDVLKGALERFSEKLEEMEKHGPTAQLWIQYFRMITLVKQFIKAERSGNWELHLSCIEKSNSSTWRVTSIMRYRPDCILLTGRDDADCKKLMQWFSVHPPFSLLDTIVSLRTEVVGGSTINCFEATKIGIQAMQNLDEKRGDLQTALMLFKDPTAEHDEIDDAGEKMLAALYGGKPGVTLNSLRYTGFTRYVTKSKFNLASLPPTKAAARQHSLRAYQQVQWWLGYKKEAESWGWQQGLQEFTPVLTSLEAAPQELLSW
ncbi:hypothetical protein JTB14_030164 [Gonioctena quinquepunctata]|nr:hypothetical protein JTB14_030164 [Gonioctena quinquepunctata]